MGSEDDENPFDDLDLEDGRDEADEQPDREAEGGTIAVPQTESKVSTQDPLDEIEIDPSEEPGFDHDDVVQGPLYAREEAWKRFRLAMKKNDLDLEETFGVEDVRKSELHDAALRVVAEHRFKVLKKVAETRSQVGNQSGGE